MQIAFPIDIHEEDRHIHFNEPLVVEFLELVDRGRVACIQFDFGMEAEISIDVEHNFVLRRLDSDADNIKRIVATLSFDLFHAFFHAPEDPNYTLYHWALRGWLRDRVQLTEDSA